MTANTNTQLKSVKNTTDSLDAIKKDIYALKSDVIELGRSVKSEGMKKIEDATIDLNEKIDALKQEGSNELDKVQNYIYEKPNQSVGIAFAAGILLALFLNRK